MNQADQNIVEKIIEYYNEKNLTRISQKIINAYKLKQYSYLIALANLIDPGIVKQSQNIQKVFSQIILLYHPDRLSTFLNEIKTISENNYNEIEKLSHIIAVTENLDTIHYTEKEEHIDDDFEFEYGYDAEDFDSILQEEFNDSFHENEGTEDFQFDFISLLRYRELGTIEDELPSFYFEELEGELDLSGSNLYDLYGLEKCINLKKLDLSNNQILDIHQIGYLEKLAELNLSGNNIHSIDSLKNCKKLKHLDISFNDITDIYPLKNFTQLKYLNIIGNQIPVEQIELLKQFDMVFIY